MMNNELRNYCVGRGKGRRKGREERSKGRRGEAIIMEGDVWDMRGRKKEGVREGEGRRGDKKERRCHRGGIEEEDIGERREI